MLTGSATGLRQGRARYCLICNESGGVIDDTIFYRLGDDEYLLIPNAGNRPSVVEWFSQWIESEFSGGVSIDDRTTETGLIALQGPGAAALLDGICTLSGGELPSSLRFFTWGEGDLVSPGFFVGRNRLHHGEEGFELKNVTRSRFGRWQRRGLYIAAWERGRVLDWKRPSCMA